MDVNGKKISLRMLRDVNGNELIFPSIYSNLPWSLVTKSALMGKWDRGSILHPRSLQRPECDNVLV
jgi:hypothetical protein